MWIPKQELILRPYQLEAIQRKLERVASGIRNGIIAFPTGGGKTLTLGKLIKELLGDDEKKHAIFIVPNLDLVEQTYKSFVEFLFPPHEIGIIQGTTNQLGRRITIATRQSLHEARLQQYITSIHGFCDVVVIDECHMSVTVEYQNIIEKLLAPWGVLIGASATPNRADGRSLLTIFKDGFVYVKDIWDLIRDRYLVDIKAYTIDAEIKPGQLRVQLNKYLEQWRHEAAQGKRDPLPTKKEELEAYKAKMSASIGNYYRYQEAYNAWKLHADGKRTLIFAKNVKEAHAYVKYFKSKGVKGEVITGSTPKEVRKRIYGKPEKLPDGTIHYSEFDRGETLILANYGVLTTGNDITSIECIIMDRPTQSHGLFTQMIGRGLRTDERIGKERLIFISLTGQDHTLSMNRRLFGVELTDIPSMRKVLEEKAEKEKEQEMLLTMPIEELTPTQRAEVQRINMFLGKDWVLDEVFGHWEKKWNVQGKEHTLLARKWGYGTYHAVHVDANGDEHLIEEVTLSSFDARRRCQEYMVEQEQLLMHKEVHDEESEDLRQRQRNPHALISSRQMDKFRKTKILFTFGDRKVFGKNLTDEDCAQLQKKMTQGEFEKMLNFMSNHKGSFSAIEGNLGYSATQGIFYWGKNRKRPVVTTPPSIEERISAFQGALPF